MINLQTSFSAANTGINDKLELATYISKITSSPREILGLEKLEIKEGEKANLTLFNPTEKWTLNKEDIVSKSKNTPFIDKELTGKVYGIINNNMRETL